MLGSEAITIDRVYREDFGWPAPPSAAQEGTLALAPLSGSKARNP